MRGLKLKLRLLAGADCPRRINEGALGDVPVTPPTIVIARGADSRTDDGRSYRPTPVLGQPAALALGLTVKNLLLRLGHRGAIGIGQREFDLAEHVQVHRVGGGNHHLLGDDRLHQRGVLANNRRGWIREPLHDGLRRRLGLRHDRLLHRVGAEAHDLRRVDDRLSQQDAGDRDNEGQDGPNDAKAHSSTS